MIHPEAPAHKIALDGEGGSETGLLLTAEAQTYDEAYTSIKDQVPDGFRLTWVRRID